MWIVVVLIVLTAYLATPASCQSSDGQPTRQVLSSSQMRYGLKQLQRMTKDRPGMLSCVSPGDEVWQWTAGQFAGASSSERIRWDNSDPDKPPEYESDSIAPTHGKPGLIHLRTQIHGKPIACERMWASVVFEFYNIQSGPKFDAIYKDAIDGRLTKSEFVRRNVAIEFETGRKTACFFKDRWLPMAQRKKISVHEHYWYVDQPMSFEEFFSHRTDPYSYPWNSWGSYYDNQIQPYLVKTGKQPGRDAASDSDQFIPESVP